MTGTSSTAITNTNAETIFDQFFTYPSQQSRSPQSPELIRLHADGLISSGLINLGLTINVRWGGLSGALLATTGAITIAASLSQAYWTANMTCVITAPGSSGTMQAQGYINFQAGLLSVSTPSMANTSPITISTAASNDLVLTATWTTAAAANSIQQTTAYALVDGP